jgi:hypothetical protein
MEKVVYRIQNFVCKIEKLNEKKVGYKMEKVVYKLQKIVCKIEKSDA